MKKTVAVLLTAVTVLSAVFAQGTKEEASGKKTYTIAGNAEWPPLEYIDEKGDIVGFEVDLLQAIGEAEDVEFDYKNVAWDGIFAGLANGAYDGIASGVSVTEERKQTMDFTEPFLYITQAIIVKAGSPELTTLEELAGKKVGTQIGITGDLIMQDANEKDGLGIDIKEYDSIGLGIEDMLNGNLDACVCDSVVASDFILGNENYKGKLVLSGQVGTATEPIAMVVGKGNSELLGVLNDGLKKVQESGKLDELKKKWNLL